MKKRFYIRPKMKIFELKTSTLLIGSGLSATRQSYGTADESDETIQTWE